jgi:hypothetical protein
MKLAMIPRAPGRVAVPQNYRARSYDKNHTFVGRVDQHGTTIRYFDKTGKFTGRSEQRGNSIRYYDSRGAFIGSRKSLAGDSIPAALSRSSRAEIRESP